VQGPLSSSSWRDEMNEAGYAVFDAIFTDQDMDALDDALAAFARREGKDLERTVAFLQKIAERDEFVRDFARRPELVEIATGLLGPDVDLYFNQHVRKNPGPQEAFSWHQDDAYGLVDPSPYLTVWIAMTDSTLENGCVWALPGSWKQGLWPHQESSFGLSCHPLDHPDQGRPVEVSRGGVAIFWSLTVHKSGPNRTDLPRKAMIFQYVRPGLRHKVSGMSIRSRLPIARAGLPVSAS